MSKGIGGAGSAMAIYSIQTSEFSSRKIGLVIVDSSDIAKEIEKIKNYTSSHFFYGSEREIASSYGENFDFDSKASQLKLIKAQLLN